MPKETQPLGLDQQFQNIVQSLEKQGVKIVYLPDDSRDDSEYDSIANQILIRRGDTETLYEEAFHVKQHQILKAMGFVDQQGKPDDLARIICELEIIRRNIHRLINEIGDEHTISLEFSRLGLYKNQARQFLGKMSKSDFSKYKKLLNHSSFKRAKSLLMEEFEEFEK